MENIRLLDCTLRDGGYINDWNFKKRTIKSMISLLCEAGIDLIEVGFLRNCIYDPDHTLFSSIREVKTILPEQYGNSRFAVMALHNLYDVNQLEECDGTVEVIRVTFHDYDIEQGLDFCRAVRDKGYKVFINPINIMGYSDADLLALLKQVNALHPYGFSIVDTFGSMTKSELIRIYSLCENNLNREITLGLHLHENMALAFSLAQNFLEQKLHTRNCILDASLNGMGRVPGNLCMELITDFLNKHYGKTYRTDHILDAIEEHILPIKEKERWGYSTEYFLSARYNLHRNYAEYLHKKGSLTARDMDQILRSIPDRKKSAFDAGYAERIYQDFLSSKAADERSLSRLCTALAGKNIVLIAPGRSLENTWEQVQEFIRYHDAVPISVNFCYDGQQSGYAFFSNAKRYDEYRSLKRPEIRLICTSNVPIPDADQKNAEIVHYTRLAGTAPSECVNSGVLLLRLLKLLKVQNVSLAGFDGFEPGHENYLTGYFGPFYGVAAEENHRIASAIKALKCDLNIRFLTPSIYEELC